MAFDSTVFSGGFELFIPVGKDREVMAGKPVIGRDVTDPGVKPDGVVMVDKVPDDPLCIFEGERRLGPDGLLLEGAVATFQLAVALWVMGRTEDMSRLPEPDELLEVPGDELRPVVGDDPGSRLRVPFPGLKSRRRTFAMDFSVRTVPPLWPARAARNRSIIASSVTLPELVSQAVNSPIHFVRLRSASLRSVVSRECQRVMPATFLRPQ